MSSMARSHSNVIPWPLTIGGSRTATVNIGPSQSTIEAALKSIPKILLGLVAYCVCIDVDISGAITQDAELPEVIYEDELYQAVVDSLTVNSEFLGVTHPKDFTPGAVLGNIYQFVAGNYEQPRRFRAVIPATAGDHQFRMIYRVNYALGLSPKPHYFAEPAGVFEGGTMPITFATEDVLDSISPGAVFGPLTVRARMWLLPDPEYRMPTPVMYNLYELQGNANSTQLTIEQFGGKSGRLGLERGTACLYASLLCDTLGLDGAITGDQVTAINSIPWLGWQDNDAPWALVDRAIDAMAPGRVIGSVDISTATRVLTDYSGYPFRLGTNPVTQAGLRGLSPDLMVVPLLSPPKSEFESSKAIRVESVENINLQFSGATGTQKVATIELGRFNDDKFRAYREYFLSIGCPKEYTWKRKLLNKGQDPRFVMEGKLDYVPWALKPPAAA